MGAITIHQNHKDTTGIMGLQAFLQRNTRPVPGAISPLIPGLLAAVVLVASTGGMLVFSGCKGLGRGASSEDHLQKAQEYIDRGDFEAAYQQLNEALSINPNDPAVHRDLGWLYIYKNDPKKAKAQLDELARIAPESVATYHLRGGLLSHLNQQQDAVESYEKAIEIDDEKGGRDEDANPRLYFDMATSLSALQEHDKALETLQEGYNYLPEEDTAGRTNFQMAICSEYYNLKDFDAANAACEKAMALTQDDEEKELINDFIQNIKLTQEMNKPAPPSDAEPDAGVDAEIPAAEGDH